MSDGDAAARPPLGGRVPREADQPTNVDTPSPVGRRRCGIREHRIQIRSLQKWMQFLQTRHALNRAEIRTLRARIRMQDTAMSRGALRRLIWWLVR